MAEPVALEAWLRQEEGFNWILDARRSDDPSERRRADRALQALDASLHGILGRGADRGWIRHRGVRYLMLVQSMGGALRVMTLARSMSWLEHPLEPAGPREPSGPTPLPAMRRSAGCYGR
jgi:hypothetical protein